MAPFRSAWLALVCLAVTGFASETLHAQDDSWAFQPADDPFGDDAMLDLRAMNEPQSGQTGFIRLSPDGNGFVRGDGQPIRFWAVGSDIYRESPEAMDQHCRFLAKRGVNMVRLHTTVAATEEGSAITDVNEKQIDGIFRFIKAAKQNGIYLTISPYYGHHQPPASWGLEGYGTEMPWGALFIDPHMQKGYRAWTRALYTRVNPHTGLAIKDDPTVAILQVHNEDSMLFWTMQRLPAHQTSILQGQFATWLKTRYGSVPQAFAAWDNHQEKGDDPAAGTVTLLSTWHLTQDWEKPGIAKRVTDQVEFLGTYQRAFYDLIGRYLRDELGCRQILNATNWRTADDARLKDVERWSYGALQVDAENEYYGSDYQHIGENNGYRIDPGHYLVNESCLHKPLELTAHFKQQVGHPFIVTETSWKNPNLYQTEGPFLIAAYQSLGGVDAVFWFSATDPTWILDARRMFWKVGDSYAIDKWSCSTPTLMGMFPASAVLFRKGYLEEAPVVVHEERSLESLWRREPALIDDNEIYGVSRESDECRTPRRADGRVSRAAFLIGRVESVLGGDPSKTRVSDLTPFLDSPRNTVRSATSQLAWDYQTGLCSMNAPRAQGVAGFLKQAGGRFELDTVQIESQDEYAAISVVALDEKPISESGRVLVQVGTTARPRGWIDEAADVPFQDQKIPGRRIVNTGEPPWMIRSTGITLSIASPLLTRATLLDVNGYPARAVDVTRASGRLVVKLPPETMYLVLQ